MKDRIYRGLKWGSALSSHWGEVLLRWSKWLEAEVWCVQCGWPIVGAHVDLKKCGKDFDHGLKPGPTHYYCLRAVYVGSVGFFKRLRQWWESVQARPADREDLTVPPVIVPDGYQWDVSKDEDNGLAWSLAEEWFDLQPKKKKRKRAYSAPAKKGRKK